MTKEFQQIEWDAAVEEDCRQLVRLAVREDLDRVFDWTTVCLVPPEAMARADVVSRQDGIVAGLRAAELALSEMDINVRWTPTVDDGAANGPRSGAGHGRGPRAKPAERRTDRAESDRAAVGNRHADATLRRCRGRQRRTDLRYAQDHARLAPLGKIRGAAGRRPQSSHRIVRRDPDQGQSPGLGRGGAGAKRTRVRPRRCDERGNWSNPWRRPNPSSR